GARQESGAETGKLETRWRGIRRRGIVATRPVAEDGHATRSRRQAVVSARTYPADRAPGGTARGVVLDRNRRRALARLLAAPGVGRHRGGGRRTRSLGRSADRRRVRGRGGAVRRH